MKYKLKEEVKKYFVKEFIHGKMDSCSWNDIGVSLEALEPVEEDILVPECIEIKGWLYSPVLYLSNGVQSLSYDSRNSTYSVYPTKTSNVKKRYKLVKCNREDLEPGDVALHCYDEYSLNECKTSLGDYCIILDDEKYVYWGGEGEVFISECVWYDWYKVVPVK